MNVWPLALALVVLPVAGCGGPSVDSACDVAGITDSVEHMVGEAGMTVDTVEELRCSGDWSVVRVSVSEEGADTTTEERFIFASTPLGWVLKAPEIVCGADAAGGTLPSELTELGCAEG